jgi:hypothetical protein
MKWMRHSALSLSHQAIIAKKLALLDAAIGGA